MESASSQQHLWCDNQCNSAAGRCGCLFESPTTSASDTPTSASLKKHDHMCAWCERVTLATVSDQPNCGCLGEQCIEQSTTTQLNLGLAVSVSKSARPRRAHRRATASRHVSHHERHYPPCWPAAMWMAI